MNSYERDRYLDRMTQRYLDAIDNEDFEESQKIWTAAETDAELEQILLAAHDELLT